MRHFYTAEIRKLESLLGLMTRGEDKVAPDGTRTPMWEMSAEQRREAIAILAWPASSRDGHPGDE